MHLLNYKQLARDLRDNKVSEREKLYYIIGTVVLSAPLLIPHAPANYDDITGELVGIFILTLLTILGTIFIYRKNQQGDGKNFIERYVCLSFPISIIGWFFGFMSVLIPSTIVMVVNHQTTLSDAAFDMISGIMGTLTIALVFALFYQGITIASTPKK